MSRWMCVLGAVAWIVSSLVVWGEPSHHVPRQFEGVYEGMLTRGPEPGNTTVTLLRNGSATIQTLNPDGDVEDTFNMYFWGTVQEDGTFQFTTVEDPNTLFKGRIISNRVQGVVSIFDSTLGRVEAKLARKIRVEPSKTEPAPVSTDADFSGRPIGRR